MQTLTALVFDNFETLDLYGVIEMFGSLPEHYRIQFASLSGGIIHNQHNVTLTTTTIEQLECATDILLVIGGQGTRQLVNDKQFLQALTHLATSADWILSVCTGSALLAKAGLLDDIQATSNKRAWQWVISQSSQVNWVAQARWVVDGKFYTSSGVSAGMDMALGFIADRHGIEVARQIAHDIEYRWHKVSTQDEFCRL
ncbi:DJ-1/PfpI family protein [Psychrobacter sp. I-STPA10]|uniref:DJ-1/PfpI family protein n=1 Tax=Psychrobacter sp. I-STPA10 TaxID=2585769 RepID=UPI001E327284|nr:DJ-1/PfpI family protein [Psychrobacter sp. I-STPA10]